VPACAHRRLGINADGCAARLLHCPVVGSLAAACVTVGGPDSGSSVDEGGTDECVCDHCESLCARRARVPEESFR
jgi:hypothetical protein